MPAKPARTDNVVTLQPANDRSRYASLRERARTLAAEIRAIQAELFVADDTGDDAMIGDAARALLEDRPLPDLKSLRDRLGALEREQTVVDRAIRMLAPEIEKAKRSDARAVADRLRPDYLDAIARVAAGLEMIAQGNQEIDRIRAQIPGGGGLLPASFPGIGRPDDLSSPSFYWHKYVREHGLLLNRRAAE